MPVRGQALVAQNIVAFGGRFLNTVNKTMEEVRVVLDEKVAENISRTDHTMKDLAKLGHPYARRYGREGKPIHDPFYKVHSQSGRLLSSKRSGTKKASINGGKLEAVAYVGLDEGAAPHALPIVYGTSKMIPRPVLEGSRQEVIGKCHDIIKTRLKDMTFRFKGTE